MVAEFDEVCFNEEKYALNELHGPVRARGQKAALHLSYCAVWAWVHAALQYS